MQLKKKKIILIEPASSERTGRFIRFTGWTAGSGGPIPVRFYPGPISRTGPETPPVDDRTGRTDWSGPVFKPMDIFNGQLDWPRQLPPFLKPKPKSLGLWMITTRISLHLIIYVNNKFVKVHY